MNKILLSILMCGTFALAKQHTRNFHAYVTHSEPVYEYRSNGHDNYDNYDNSNYYRSDYNNGYESNYNTNRHSNNNNTIGLDTIVGGTIGVIIGNQIGKGNGKTAAKIVGGLLGASIANNTRYDNSYAQNTGYVKHYDDRNRYKKHHKKRKQKVLVGYKNYFVYKNREFYKFSNHRKNRIRITETINF
jgi:outer membrane lipoprotein SlyB